VKRVEAAAVLVGGLVVTVGVAGWAAVTVLGRVLDFDISLQSSAAAQTTFGATVDGNEQHWSTPMRRVATSPPALADGAVFVRDEGGRVGAYDATTGRLRWRVKVDQGSQSGIDFAPTVANGTVYVAGWNGWLDALDAATGRQRWTMPLSLSLGETPPRESSIGGTPSGGFPVTVAGGIVYVDVRGVTAFDAVDGHVRWNTSTGGTQDAGYASYSPPIVGNGFLYVGGDDGAVRALDATTGVSRWSSAAFAWSPGSASLPGIGPTSSLTLSGDVVYAVARDARLHAFDARTGAPRWDVAIGVPNVYGSAPVVVDGTVYAVTNAVHAVDAATGASRWIAPVGGAPLYAYVPPNVRAGIVYAPGGDARLHALDAHTGVPRWVEGRVPRGRHSGPFLGPHVAAVAPAVGKDAMYVVSGPRLRAYGLTGAAAA
jgi:outer membrane protein assembly factor BamB